MHYTKKRAKILLFFDICKKSGRFFVKTSIFLLNLCNVCQYRARVYTLRCIVKCMFFYIFLHILLRI
jgi:hypothetical protein